MTNYMDRHVNPTSDALHSIAIQSHRPSETPITEIQRRKTQTTQKTQRNDNLNRSPEDVHTVHAHDNLDSSSADENTTHEQDSF